MSLGLTPTPPSGTAAGAARVEGTSAARTGRRDDHILIIEWMKYNVGEGIENQVYIHLESNGLVDRVIEDLVSNDQYF